MRVKKASGELEAFDEGKIIHNMQKSGFSQGEAQRIAAHVKEEAYDEIPTKKLHFIIYRAMREENPICAMRYRLRDAISLLSPDRSEFERFTARLLAAKGYDAVWEEDQLIQGLCTTNELDVVARRNGNTHLVECKHHFHHHRYTGLDVPMRQFARMIDIRDGYEDGKTGIDPDRMWVVTNTKMSRHAIDFADCRGIELLAWKHPEGEGLDALIGETGMYPITVYDVTAAERERLSDNGILTVHDVLDVDPRDAPLPGDRFMELRQTAEKLVNHQV